MKHKTHGEFLAHIDEFKRTDHDTVIIHPNSLMEFDEEFIKNLKEKLAVRMAMAHHGVDTLNEIEQFAVYVLDEAF